MVSRHALPLNFSDPREFHPQGEHIHLGYYDEADRKAVTNPFKSMQVFKDTKYR